MIMENKSRLLYAALITIIVAIAIGLYWYFGIKKDIEVKDADSAIDALSGTTQVPETNPVKKVPDLNPTEKTNPFKTTNPFQ